MTSVDPDPALHIDERSDGIVHLSGELDMATAPQLRAALQRLLDAGASRVVVDVADLSFCDSTGLTVFVWAHQSFPAENGFILQNPTERMRLLLRTTQLEQEFDIR